MNNYSMLTFAIISSTRPALTASGLMIAKDTSFGTSVEKNKYEKERLNYL